MSDSTAKNWLGSHRKSVPALDIFHQKTLEALKSETVSLFDLADIISLDPGMSIPLFEKINGQRNDSNRSRLDSVHSLLSLMGIPAVTNFVNQLQTLESSGLSDYACQAYHQLMSRNFHLVHQSAQLIELQGMNNTHEIQAAALLHNVGEIYACLFDFQQYQKYQQTYLTNNVAVESAESIFGYNFAELGRLLSDELHLPDLARGAHQQSKSISRKARTLQIAAEITQQAETGWNHDAFTRSLEFGAEYLECSVVSLRKRVLSTALEAALDFPIADVSPAIAKAILLPTEDKPKPQSIPAPSSVSFSDKVKSRIKLSSTIHAGIIDLLITELTDELQLSRVVLMLLSKDSAVLSTRKSKGLDTGSPLLKLQIKVSQGGLIKNLITRPQALWVKPATFKNYAPLLPGKFRDGFRSENFFLMSLFIGEKPIGIIFCDSTQNLDETLYQTFKSNLLVTGKALTFLAQRAKKSKKSS